MLDIHTNTEAHLGMKIASLGELRSSQEVEVCDLLNN